MVQNYQSESGVFKGERSVSFVSSKSYYLITQGNGFRQQMLNKYLRLKYGQKDVSIVQLPAGKEPKFIVYI